MVKRSSKNFASAQEIGLHKKFIALLHKGATYKPGLDWMYYIVAEEVLLVIALGSFYCKRNQQTRVSKYHS